jgi:hypothetical protein
MLQRRAQEEEQEQQRRVSDPEHKPLFLSAFVH